MMLLKPLSKQFEQYSKYLYNSTELIFFEMDVRPFVVFTKFFSEQSYVTISYAYVFYRFIMNHLDKSRVSII
jgi:hypothetical protein